MPPSSHPPTTHEGRDCQSVPSYTSYSAQLKTHTRRSMAFSSTTHMPFLSITSSHLPKSSVVRTSRDIAAKSTPSKAIQRRPLYIRYLHLRPASQVMQRMPTPCLLYTSTRRRTQSPLRTVVLQDRTETVPIYVRSRRRIQGPDESFARDALSDATRSRARVILLPSRRTVVPGSRYEDAVDDLSPGSQHVPVRLVRETRKPCRTAEKPR